MDFSPKFIVFEGIDGAGKSTQIRLLSDALAKRGIECDLSSEPTTFDTGKKLREALSGKVRKTPLEMAEMFVVDRVAHNTHPTRGINKLLSEGKTVISDRYYYSSLAYQGAELGFEAVAALNLDNSDIRTPDLCIFLDLSPEDSLARIGHRQDVPTEIFENYECLAKTRKMFFDVFERLRDRGENIAIINASGSIEEIADSILREVNSRLFS